MVVVLPLSVQILQTISNLLSALGGLAVIFKIILAYMKWIALMLILLSMSSKVLCFVWDSVFFSVEAKVTMKLQICLAAEVKWCVTVNTDSNGGKAGSVHALLLLESCYWEYFIAI